MKAMRPTTSEEMHSQSEAVRKNERRKGQIEKLYAIILSYAGHTNMKNAEGEYRSCNSKDNKCSQLKQS